MKSHSFNVLIVLALLLSLLGGAITVTPARAASFTASTAAELITAINNANANVDSDADIITLTADITITVANNTGMSGSNGLPVILAAGGNLIIEGDGHTISSTGGASSFRFFENQGGNLTLNNITLSNANAQSGGGAIFSSGTLTLTNSTLSNNTSPNNGGGIYSSGTLIVTNSTLSGNTANNNGGGIYNFSGTTTVTNSTLTGNTANNDGGGIYNFSGTATVTNSTLSGNTASIAGGGISNSGTLTVTNSTLSNNSAPAAGAGIYTSGSTTLNLTNSIIAYSPGDDCVTSFGTTLTGSNNLVEDGSCSAALSGDPKLGPLANNGGFTQTHALLAGSTAIDTGTNTGCPATDQRGVTRPQGAGCDIGAFELNTFTSTFTSQALQDGRLLESSETSNAGGWLDSSATTFIVGDDNVNRQYRSILHFDTSALPDSAIITKAVLAIKRQGITGSDPFLSLGLLQVDMRRPDFGAPSLELSDFNAAPAKTNVGSFSSSLATPWHRAVLNNPAERYVNLLGSTQFRLYFVLDDNDNNSADFIRFYSGDSHTGSSPAASRPKLIITYYVP